MTHYRIGYFSAGLLWLAFSCACGSGSAGDEQRSPSGDYTVRASVNRISTDSSDYALLEIHVKDKTGADVATIDTRTGDAEKWSVEWTKVGDTIVLKSSENGDRAWSMLSGVPLPVSH